MLGLGVIEAPHVFRKGDALGRTLRFVREVRFVAAVSGFEWGFRKSHILFHSFAAGDRGFVDDRTTQALVIYRA